MKIIPAACIFLMMLSVSCKKTGDQPNTAPPVTDTTKSPVVKVDTSTLLKSMLIYFYDASGTEITDSTLIEWKYDNQRRVIQNSRKISYQIDTLFYTYSNDRYTTDSHSYTRDTLSGVYHTVYYQHLQNRTDSVIRPGERTYYYYNQLGQDSLEKTIGSFNSTPINQTNYYYTGQNLDSAIAYLDGMRSTISYYTNGNMTEFDLYKLDANNALEIVSTYTYTNIPVGGLNVYFSGTNLQSGSIGGRIAGGSTTVETDEYQLDAANRVSVWTVHQTYPQKYLLSYY